MAACMDCGGSECVCRLRRKARALEEALQIFMAHLGGEDGYFPQLGAQATSIVKWKMRTVGVEPQFAPESSACICVFYDDPYKAPEQHSPSCPYRRNYGRVRKCA